MKKCNLCLRLKPESEFHKHSASPDGLSSHCKDCQTIRMRDYRARKKQAVCNVTFKKMLSYFVINRLKNREYFNLDLFVEEAFLERVEKFYPEEFSESKDLLNRLKR